MVLPFRIFIALSLGGAPCAAFCASVQQLHSFNNNAQGSAPYGGVVAAGNVLIGSNAQSGKYGFGTIYESSSKGRVSSLYSFKDNGDGRLPNGGLLDIGGRIYGTTLIGGTGADGTVFTLNKNGREKVLYSFKGGEDGIEPTSGLIDVKGVFYGTTYLGGHSGNGTVYALTRNGTETVLHSFSGGSDGANPSAELIAFDGDLYGCAYRGGTNNAGVVFKMDKSSNETLLHSFGIETGDGLSPSSALVRAGGRFYGTTASGGTFNKGTVFSITPGGVEKVVYAFGANNGDGVNPDAALVSYQGVLYGTTYAGGAAGLGTVFSLTPSGTEIILHSFQAGGSPPDGEQPTAALAVLNGQLFGTTSYGGRFAAGTIFRVAP